MPDQARVLCRDSQELVRACRLRAASRKGGHAIAALEHDHLPRRHPILVISIMIVFDCHCCAETRVRSWSCFFREGRLPWLAAATSLDHSCGCLEKKRAAGHGSALCSVGFD